MATQTWKYYDFDANWDEFYKIWMRDDVQQILKIDMDNWCKTEAYFVNNHERPTWNIGEPLWNLSRTDYHESKIMDKANQYVEDNNMLNIYKKRMREILNVKFKNNEDAYEHFSNMCFENIMDMFKPKKGSIDSLILVMGKHYIEDALMECAVKLFPDEEIVNDDESILIPGQKLVFDLFDFYWTKNGSTKFLQKDEYYDDMCADFE